jgi:hypothetical protein
MSDFSTFCDAVQADLVGNVAGLGSLAADAKHLYAPWNPYALQPDGRRHLAIWPDAESADTPEPAAIEAHELAQVYLVLVWEGAELEGQRLSEDQAGAAAFLDLHNAVRARFYVEANQHLGGAELCWYAGTAFSDAAALVRWFVIRLAARFWSPFV